MTSDKNAVNEAIDKLIELYQERADEEKALAPARAAMNDKIAKLVDDLAAMGPFDETGVTDEMIAAYLITEQTVMQKMMQGDMSGQMMLAKFDEGFSEGLNEYLGELQQDPQKIAGLQATLDDMQMALRPPQVQINRPIMEVAINEPEDGHGTWTLAVVPLIIDEDYNVKVADKLDFDLSLVMKVTPPDSLSSTFNVPGVYIKEGEKFEPFSITAETSETGPLKHVMISGEIYKNGQIA